MNCPSAISAQLFLHSCKAETHSERSECINCVFIGFQLALHHIYAAGIYLSDSQDLGKKKSSLHTLSKLYMNKRNRGYLRNKDNNRASLSHPGHHLEVKVPVTLVIVLEFRWIFTSPTMRCTND